MQIELNYPEPVPVKLDPAKTMLLIVDMENEDAHPSGKRYMGEAVEEIIPKLVALRHRVRAARLFIPSLCGSPTLWNLLSSKMSSGKSRAPGAPNLSIR
jgi:hypothetical protein